MNISFYNLKEQTLESAQTFICKIVAKSYRQKLNTVIYTNELAFWDEKLFSFSSYDFIPHQINHSTAPVQITSSLQNLSNAKIVLNLTDEYLEQDNIKLLEFILPIEEKIQRAREKYKFYKSKHYQIQTLL
jgi:DNA polymerase IIIc chi subunit